MVVELAPCIQNFCPWKLIPIPFDPEDDPTDPVDPSPDDVGELPEEIKEKLPCDKFKGLCEPDITLITKNDLVKQDHAKACDDKCDGVCTKKDGSQSAGESCKEGDPSKDEDWTQCGTTEVSRGSVCTEHKKGSDKYTVTHGAGAGDKPPSVEEQAKREQEALDLARHYSESDNCKPGKINMKGGNETSFDVTCN